MSPNKPKGDRLIIWLRLHTGNKKFWFTSQDAMQATGYQVQYVSTALTSLIARGGFGIQRIQPGHYVYDPELDKGRPAALAGNSNGGSPMTTGPDTSLSSRVLRFMHAHPYEPFTVKQISGAVEGNPTSVSGVLGRLVRSLDAPSIRSAGTKGVYRYVPEAPDAPGYNPGPMAGKTTTELPPAPAEVTPERTEPTSQTFELVGKARSGALIVKSADGVLYQLTEM